MAYYLMNAEEIMNKIKILVCDDHTVMRQGTCKLFEQESDFKVIGEAGDGEEAVKLAIDLMPDVVLMDIAMPKMDGITATRKIKDECPSINVLILSAYDDDQFVFKLLQAGAAGYLLKNCSSQQLVAAVRSIHHGESVLHPTIARKVLDRFLKRPAKSPDQNMYSGLSEREIDLLKLMAKGLDNGDIANKLGLSLRTVQVHLRNIFQKLGVSSRIEAVLYALREGLVTLDAMPSAEHVETTKEKE
jgi:DNA-binding NarL/FixJ family response regulator